MGNLAEVSMRKGDRSQAVEYLRQALEAGESTGDEVVIANAHMVRGDLEEANHDRAAADHNFAAAIQILQYLKIPDRLREAQMHVAEVLEARGDMTGAARHWRAAAEVGTWRALGRPAAGAAAEVQEETAAG
jgi:Tfp pilus assembly protein PilF